MKFSVKYILAMVATTLFMVACAPDKGNEPDAPDSPNTPTNPEQPQDPQEPSNPQEPETPGSSDGDLLIPTQEGSAAVNDGYTLVWEDLFDEGYLDESVWNVEVNGNGGGNNELQYYRRENITFEAEPTTNRQCLVLTARKENYSGKNATSGRLNTKGKVAYQYGKIEALIKLPSTYNTIFYAFLSSVTISALSEVTKSGPLYPGISDAVYLSLVNPKLTEIVLPNCAKS
jgi:hypothetical protein